MSRMGSLYLWRRRFAGAVVALTVSLPLPAQVFTATGGVSTISNVQGGQLNMSGSSYSFSVGGGESNGDFAGGFRFVKQTQAFKYTVGDQYSRFDLPTDIFDPGHYVDLVGVGIERVSRGTDFTAFAGALSQDMSNPIFAAASTDHAAGAVVLKQKLGADWKLSSYNLLSAKVTSILGLQWQPVEHLSLGLSGGVGAGHPYAASSMDFSSDQLDLKAVYIYADSQFERSIGRSPALAEPDRENLSVVWRPAGSVTFSGGHQNLLSSPSSSTPELRSSVDDLSIGATVLGVETTLTSFHSAYLGTTTNAFAGSASRNFGQRFAVEETYLQSRPSAGTATTTVLTNIRETLTPRLSLSELITESAGQTTVAIGGAFLSNLASLSVDYQNYYVPTRTQDPFQRAIIADLQLHASGRVTLHGMTFVDPLGHLKYMADAMCVLDRQDTQPTAAQRIVIGGSVLFGRVIDEAGHAVPGAALLIDDALIYTDSAGRFFLRERRARIHKFSIATERFLNEGHYSILSSPRSVSSGPAEREDVVVVLRLLP